MAGDDVEEQRRVGDRRRERPDLVERAGERDQPVAGHPPVGRLDADRAAQRGGLADRAAGVGAQREGAKPAATAAAEPPLDPPGTRNVSLGLAVGPNAEFSVDEPIANSSQLVLPTTTPPAAWMRSTVVAVYGGSHPARIREPQVVATPRVQSVSLIATGTPARGPGSSPRATVASTASAASRARSATTARKAWSSPSRPSMAARCSSTTSRADRCPDRTEAAISVAVTARRGSAGRGTGRSSTAGAWLSTSSRGRDGRTSSRRSTLTSGSGWAVGSTSSRSSAARSSTCSRMHAQLAGERLELLVAEGEARQLRDVLHLGAGDRTRHSAASLRSGPDPPVRVGATISPARRTEDAVPKYQFLSDEWFVAVDQLVEEHGAEAPGAADVVMNLTVTDTPFGPERRLHLGLRGGRAHWGSGPSTTPTCRSRPTTRRPRTCSCPATRPRGCRRSCRAGSGSKATWPSSWPPRPAAAVRAAPAPSRPRCRTSPSSRLAQPPQPPTRPSSLGPPRRSSPGDSLGPSSMSRSTLHRSPWLEMTSAMAYGW